MQNKNSALTLGNLGELLGVLRDSNNWRHGHELGRLVLNVFDFNEQCCRARIHLSLIVPVHRQHSQLVQVLLLVVQVTDQADDTLSVHGRY